jgi:hypothetical protein
MNMNMNMIYDLLINLCTFALSLFLLQIRISGLFTKFIEKEFLHLYFLRLRVKLADICKHHFSCSLEFVYET